MEVGDSSSEAIRFTKLAESLNKHFKREEQILFPILGRSLGSDICDRLKNEHARRSDKDWGKGEKLGEIARRNRETL
jgi:iron-sulfur cluster repair protein YtfE (RIC family)